MAKELVPNGKPNVERAVFYIITVSLWVRYECEESFKTSLEIRKPDGQTCVVHDLEGAGTLKSFELH